MKDGLGLFNNAGAVKLIIPLLNKTNTSQTDLVKETGLKKATVSNITNLLKKGGLVAETGKGEAGSTGGPRPRYLKLATNKIIAIGCALRNKSLKTALVNADGETLSITETEISENHSSLFIPEIVSQIKALLPEAKKKGLFFLGAGVGIGGVYDKEKEIYLRFSAQNPAREETNLPLAEILRKKLPDLLLICDDLPNAMALGEVWFGCAKNLDDFVYLQLTNMKATVLLKKTIFRGHGRFAGQIGDWRYGKTPVRFALSEKGFPMDVVTDLAYNIMLSYSPQKIILSKENIPEGFVPDIPAINSVIRERLEPMRSDLAEENLVETGVFDAADRARAAATLVFDRYFHHQAAENGY